MTISSDLYRRACKVLPGGNTRTTLFYPPFPQYARSGQGCRVTDVDGTVVIDAINNFTSMIHGYGHPATAEAVVEQLAKGTCFGMPTETEIDLAELLAERLPAMDQFRFCNSGTEAVMTAIKAARAFTGRPMIAKCEGAYHGTYDYAEVSQSTSPDTWGDAARPAAVPVARATPQGVLDDVIVIPFNDAVTAEEILRGAADKLAGVLLDPLPNRVGLMPPDPEFLSMLRRVTADIGCLLIWDEVISFRLGYHGAQGRFDIQPDMVCLGKIIGGGFPVGAVAGRRDVMAVFDPSKGTPAVPHGGTFSANPITMVAGLATMQHLDHPSFDRLDNLGDQLQSGLENVMRRLEFAGQITGCGSLRRLHLTFEPIINYRSAYVNHAKAGLMARIHRAVLEAGVLIAPTGLMALSTAMDEPDVEEIIDAFDRALTKIQSD